MSGILEKLGRIRSAIPDRIRADIPGKIALVMAGKTTIPMHESVSGMSVYWQRKITPR